MFALAASAQPGALPTIASPAPNPIPSGAEVPLQLDEAIAIGLRDNRTIKSAYLQRIVQKYDFVVSSDPFRPTLSLRGSLNRNRVSGETYRSSSYGPVIGWQAPTGATASFSWSRENEIGGASGAVDTTSLSLTQPLLRGAGFDINAAPIERARLQEQQNRLALRDTVGRTVGQIIYAYRRLLSAQEQEKLAERSLQRTRDLLETNRALIVAGRMAEADIVQTESSIANQEVALLQARQTKQSAQLSLLTLLALDPRINVVAVDSINADYVPVDLETVTRLAMDSRADVLSQQNAVRYARIELKQAKNARLWDVSATVGVTRQDYERPLPGIIDRGTDVRTGLQLNIPVGDRTLKQREISADINLRNQELQYEGLMQSLEVGVLDAVRRVEASWRQLEAARRARELAERALDIQREKLQVGRASNYEVLSLEASLQSAATQELSAGIAYLDSLTSLDEYVGSTLETWQINLND